MRLDGLVRAGLMGIIVVHGLIHLLGFVKAFGLVEIDELTQDIPRPIGVLWLLAAVLFLALAVVFLLWRERWWAPAIPTVVLSQVLIVDTWQDSRLGTLPNAAILAVALLGAFEWSFDARVEREMGEVLERRTRREGTLVTEAMVADLPPAVRRWLEGSGAVGRGMVRTLRLRQRGTIMLRPGGRRWLDAEAEQVISFEEPAFVWKVDVTLFPLVSIKGRDLFVDGQGRMEIKALSLMSLVDVSSEDKLNESALQRYLSEIALCPPAALSPHIQWEAIDGRSARAMMSYGGTSGSVTFHFNDEGEFARVTAMRYRDVGDDEPTPWEAKATETGVVDSIRVPTRLEVTWSLPDGSFTWYRFEVSDVDFDP
jgi:hypothetical protein